MAPRRPTERDEQQQLNAGEGLYIKQVATMLGVTPAMIRSWETAGLISPPRSPSGFRLYTLTDIVRLQRIRELVRGRGVNIAGVREILEAEHPNGVSLPAVSPSASLGDRLRSLRMQRGLSLRSLASKTELSPSTISSFERSLSRPSVASLQKIASALGTNLVSLMDDGSARSASVVVKKQHRRQVKMDDPGVTIEQLAAVETQLEPLLFRIAPGASSGSSYTHDGEEFLYVLGGEFEITLDELTTYTLNEGDAMTFASVRPHRFRNPGTVDATVVWINTPPTF
jgi:DNA-binding transcriptional MerR regulator